MGFELTVQKLTELRQDLSAEKQLQEERVADLIRKQRDIDTAIVALGLESDVAMVRPSPGDNARATLAVLRRASRPLTSGEIARQVLIARGLDFENEKLLSKTVIRVRIELRRMASDGTAKSRPAKYPESEWSLAQ